MTKVGSAHRWLSRREGLLRSGECSCLERPLPWSCGLWEKNLGFPSGWEEPGGITPSTHAPLSQPPTGQAQTEAQGQRKLLMPPLWQKAENLHDLQCRLVGSIEGIHHQDQNRGVRGGKEDAKTMQRAEETIINILEERRGYIHFPSYILCMI